ncbi:MAG: P-loop NTPase [Prolixibacteraceae bacterium]
MNYKIAIASGKGGTGKTTVSVNLYKYLSEALNNSVRLIDCDVEEPNDLLFFNNAIQLNQTTATQLIPHINTDHCTFCGKCAEYCEFNAISIIPSVKYAQVDASLCHSCGACSVACQFDAITEHEEAIGTISEFETSFGKGLTAGNLSIGSSMQTMMISKTKASLSNDQQITLFDSPPGTSCPVVETIADTDYVILVTEPTPFGLHDVQLMIELVHNLSKPFGLIINKAGLGNDELKKYIQANNIVLLGEIPFLKSYAASYSTGNLLQNPPAEIDQEYRKITSKILQNLNQQ